MTKSRFKSWRILKKDHITRSLYLSCLLYPGYKSIDHIYWCLKLTSCKRLSANLSVIVKIVYIDSLVFTTYHRSTIQFIHLLFQTSSTLLPNFPSILKCIILLFQSQEYSRSFKKNIELHHPYIQEYQDRLNITVTWSKRSFTMVNTIVLELKPFSTV